MKNLYVLSKRDFIWYFTSPVLKHPDASYIAIWQDGSDTPHYLRLTNQEATAAWNSALSTGYNRIETTFNHERDYMTIIQEKLSSSQDNTI